MNLDIRLSRDRTGRYIAHCPTLPYCLSHGRSEEEARANINLLIREWLETDRILASRESPKSDGLPPRRV